MHKDLVVKGVGGRPMLTDVFFINDGNKKPVIIYAHGFNGFKDWGNFDLMGKRLADEGFVFVKFNFSHNGTTINEPEVFADLAAYAENNYTKELDDLEAIIDWVLSGIFPYSANVEAGKIYLLGHSMGGGITVLKANEDSRIKAVVTWASIGECKTPWGNWNPEKIEQWKTDEVTYVVNGRTKQQMPLNYQLYEDYNNNKERLNIKQSVQNLRIPILLCHGYSDEAVPVQTAFDLHAANPNTKLFLMESDHVFGRKHPWTEANLPLPMQEVLDATINFFRAL